MSDYNKATDFAAKDALTTGDPDKIIKGTPLDDEFNAISVAVATKADRASPTFSGTVTMASLTATGTVTASGTIVFTGATITNLGSVTTADINGGTIDGSTIGATTPAPATTTTLEATGAFDSPGIQDAGSHVSQSIIIDADGDVMLSAGNATTTKASYVGVDEDLAIVGSEPSLRTFTNDGSAPVGGTTIHNRAVSSQNASLADREAYSETVKTTESWSDTVQGAAWRQKIVPAGSITGLTSTVISWDNTTTYGMAIGAIGGSEPLYNAGFGTLTLAGSSGGVFELTDDVTTQKGRVYWLGASDQLTLHNNVTNGDLQMTVSGTGEVKGFMRGGALADNNESQIKVESALPGTPDANTIYFIV